MRFKQVAAYSEVKPKFVYCLCFFSPSSVFDDNKKPNHQKHKI